jgi:hydroxymethylbilane synthase
MARIFRIATRDGDLALSQTGIFIAAMKKAEPGVNFEIVKITTAGDADRSSKLWKVKNPGFFTSRIEEAIINDEADIAVHSYKDLPTAMSDELCIGAVMKRTTPGDCIVANRACKSLAELPKGAILGTSSLRRIVQLKKLSNDIKTVAIRGNVQTRIKKLESENLDGVVLAKAGLERLGLESKIAFEFNPAEFISAPAQGAIAIQTRANDEEARGLASAADDRVTRLLTDAERQILVTLGCGCHAPVGCYAESAGADVVISAFISDAAGENLVQSRKSGRLEDGRIIAEKLADELVEKGGESILKVLNNE